ncbi:MAG: hypothetical protein WCO19_03375 [Candidatus Saccharibacteria bacterium]
MSYDPYLSPGAYYGSWQEQEAAKQAEMAAGVLGQDFVTEQLRAAGQSDMLRQQEAQQLQARAFYELQRQRDLLNFAAPATPTSAPAPSNAPAQVPAPASTSTASRQKTTVPPAHTPRVAKSSPAMKAPATPLPTISSPAKKSSGLDLMEETEEWLAIIFMGVVIAAPITVIAHFVFGWI